MHKTLTSITWLACLVCIGALVGVGVYRTQIGKPMLLSLQQHPRRVMGTDSTLMAVVPADQVEVAEAALARGERALRDVESRVSWRIAVSELARVNAAHGGQVVPLSEQTVHILTMAREMYERTDGAFDATSNPLFAVWRKAGKDGKLPTQEAIDQARDVSGWEHYELHADALTKLRSEASLDVGGIAKGFGIDRAVDEMLAAGARGGLVNVGGDIRVFGEKVDGSPWQIGVKDPFGRSGAKPIAVLYIRDAAVCTSGNYERFAEIGGKRFSHIVDPRTGWPVDYAPSVTVVAPTAAEADVWATALSVLGPAGRALIAPESGVEAMLIVGTPEDYEAFKTPGFDALLTPPGDPIDQAR